jgi:hypothetical protein
VSVAVTVRKPEVLKVTDTVAAPSVRLVSAGRTALASVEVKWTVPVKLGVTLP